MTPHRAIALLSACMVLAACGDDAVTTPTDPSPLDGTWEFTLTDPGDPSGSVAVYPGVELAEVDGLVAGSLGEYRMEGGRRGDEIELDVRYPSGTDGHRQQSTMRLVLRGDTMVGGGVSSLPTVSVPQLADGSPHPKYLAQHGDSEIHTGIERFGVKARRTGPLQTSASAVMQAAVGVDQPLPASLPDVLCAAVGSAFSFALGKITGGAFRPMGGCWGRHDGGGYYLFGRDGPGSALPLWTQTVYRAQEWSLCKVRTYHFAVSIGGPVAGLEIAQILVPAWVDANRSWLERAGINPDDRPLWYQQTRSLYDLTGGFAISVAFSTHTNNWSIYVNTVNNTDRTVVLNHPLIKAIHEKYVAEHGSGKVWIFVGPRIHDTFNMRRALADVCNDRILFSYLFGTHNVHYD